MLRRELVCVLEFILKIYHRTSYPAVPLCRGSNKWQSRGWIISNFMKGDNVLASYNNYVLLKVISPCTPVSSKRRPSSELQFGQEENIYGQSLIFIKYSFHLKEELSGLFRKFPGIPCPHRQSNKRMVTLYQWLTLLTSVRNSLEDESIVFTHFFLHKDKN